MSDKPVSSTSTTGAKKDKRSRAQKLEESKRRTSGSKSAKRPVVDDDEIIREVVAQINRVYWPKSKA